MKTHVITEDLSNWWAAYGANHSSAEWQTYVKHLADLVAVKCKEISEAHSNDGRFGMSGSGGCTRRSALKMLGFPEEPFDSDTLVTFHIGHLLESVPIATLRAMGYTVGGLQEPVKVGDYMQSYTDGIITAGPRDLPYPICLSIKTAGYKMSYWSQDAKKIRRNGFAALPFEGVKEGHPTWYAQSQMEMLGTGNTHSLVVVIAKDIVQAFKGDEYMKSLSFYAEMIEADPKQQRLISGVWEKMWNKAKEKPEADDIPAYCYHKNNYVEIPEPGSAGGEGKRGWSLWGGPNKEVLPFNICGNCAFRAVCAGEKQDAPNIPLHVKGKEGK